MGSLVSALLGATFLMSLLLRERLSGSYRKREPSVRRAGGRPDGSHEIERGSARAKKSRSEDNLRSALNGNLVQLAGGAACLFIVYPF